MFYDNINIYYMFDSGKNYVSNSIFGVYYVGVFTNFGIKGTKDYEIVLIHEGYDEYKTMEELFYKILSKAELVAIKYDPADYKEQLKYSRKLLKEGNSAIVSKYLSIYSMPEDLLEELLDNPNYLYIYEITAALQNEFEAYIKDNLFVEIVDKSILDLDSFVDKSFWGYKYTSDQYRRHLECIVRKLKDYENYYFLTSENIEAYTMFHINKNSGVLIVFAGKENKGLFSSSTVITSILDNYLKSKYLNIRPYKEIKEKMISELEKKIESLK